MIKSVGLSIYFDNWDQMEIELSPTQTLAIIKLLGIEAYDGNGVACYSDATLKEFMEMKSNPFKLKKAQD